MTISENGKDYVEIINITNQPDKGSIQVQRRSPEGWHEQEVPTSQKNKIGDIMKDMLDKS